MNTIIHSLPALNSTLRHSLYQGEIYLAPSHPSSLALVKEIKQLISAELGLKDIRQAHMLLDEQTFFQKIGSLRRKIYCEPMYQKAIFTLLEICGFDCAKMAVDPFRLRVIQPFGHLNERAAPVYYPHRDTWYAHPQSTLVLWVPLDSLQEEETFEFYPEYFARPVENNSRVFNYDDWVKEGPELKIGWQDINSGKTAVYPKSQKNTEIQNALGFSCEEGHMLFFSGQHYHKTKPQITRQIRYSLDVRLVHLEDEANHLGPQNVDNLSRGYILKDYIKYKP